MYVNLLVDASQPTFANSWQSYYRFCGSGFIPFVTTLVCNLQFWQLVALYFMIYRQRKFYIRSQQFFSFSHIITLACRCSALSFLMAAKGWHRSVHNIVFSPLFEKILPLLGSERFTSVHNDVSAISWHRISAILWQ